MIAQLVATLALTLMLDAAHCPPSFASTVVDNAEARSACQGGCEKNYVRCSRRPWGTGMAVCAAERRDCYRKCRRAA